VVDSGADIRADARWMTYEEAGRVLGVDPDSVAPGVYGGLASPGMMVGHG
jgi:hypothetical protein